MKDSEQRSKQLQRYLTLFPWFGGFSADLLFWIAIDSLFLQFVKGLTLSEIVFVTACSDVLGILLQFPMIWLIEKLGNTKTVRLGASIALLSSLVLTLGEGFLMMVLGKALRELSFSCKTMNNVSLKHNLELLERPRDFIRYSTKANTVYAVTTMLISLFASLLFNYNHYLPMLGCIAVCLFCVILSFFMADYTEEDRLAFQHREKKRKEKLHLPRLTLWAFISYGIFFSIVTTGQDNTKLFIQDELWKGFDEEHTALIIGVIVFISRVVRVFANILFQKIYHRLGNRSGILLPFLLFSCFVCMLLGYFIPNNLAIAKYTVMGFGYIIILFTRDPFKLYIQDLVMHHSENRHHPKIMMLLELSRKITTAVIGLSFASILAVTSMASIILIYAVYALIEILVGIYLYHLTKPADCASA